MRNLTLLTLCLALFLSRSSYGHQRLVVFGDSLSDIGNSFALTEGFVLQGLWRLRGLFMVIMAKRSIGQEQFF